ncbi:MAG: aminotransferase class I/II-fold pyridoxal phosphate-dependent enzyme [Pseudomonadota bacterium]
MRFSPLVARIAGEGAAAWALHSRATQAAETDPDVIIMSVGDPDLETPQIVKDAAIRALQENDTHYTTVAGVSPLRVAVARRFSEQTGVPYGLENVMITPGTQSALFFSSMCLAGPGDEILAPEPMYVTYEATVQVTGAKLVRAPQPAENGFRPIEQAMAEAITPKTRVILITTPNNPTGVALTHAELSMIADLAREHDLWVISDEVYGRTLFGREHVSIAALPGMAERTVTVAGLSKSHAMTGWRIGWAIGPRELVAHFDNLALCMLYGLPGFTQTAAVVALADGPDGAWDAADGMRDIYQRRCRLALSALNQISGLSCVEPEGGMFAMMDVRGTGMSAAEFANGLFEAEKVSVLDATAFGPSAQGHVRLSFAIADDRLEEACARIGRFVRGRT